MKKVLVIDDDPVIVALLEKRLQSAGFQIMVASNGATGMERMCAEPPDLVIFDVMMPGLDGYSFLSEVRSNEQVRDIPMIVITGRGELGDLFRTESVAAFFQKPFNMDDLVGEVRAILGN
ncbi:MAG: response regulator [Candidatus Omnitrophica bacterium]|nr:response regulator [Candidatus Omnitrophota bacterium]